ncbi:MAG: hypothetical protein IKN91_01095 [Paludibacteraceae bacterium]|nr:hypothetical protein [Paludibacteraceae bacterium]
MKKIPFIALLAFATIGMLSCKSDLAQNAPIIDEDITDETNSELPEWYYTAGRLGTTSNNYSTCFEQPTPAVDNAGLASWFDRGDQLAEKDFHTVKGKSRYGLGPVYVRASCQHCHPGYSHGTSVPSGRYNAIDHGNGTLLVVYDPATQAYANWVAGMPQLFGVAPFKAPIDPEKIEVIWHTATDGAFPSRFPDGEEYELRYPEVKVPHDAIYGWDKIETLAAAKGHSTNYIVGLENTIGIYGTGLLDAIPDDSIIAQWRKEEMDGYMQNGLNTAYFSDGMWKNWYKSSIVAGNGKSYVRRFTYAMSRGPLLDAAGANAIWNITNVTRSNRTLNYLSLDASYYATIASQDPDVQAGFPEYIANISNATEHPEWFTDNVEQNIYNYLTSKTLPAEMSDADFTAMMVWHRGLAVPAARNVNDEEVLRGKELFSQIGCDYCHRPSWTTGDDNVEDPNMFFASANASMPRYPHQTIWPYTDMVQHKLHMVSDIRTGWCRTTPLWGRGLHRKATGDVYEARLHDTRARNVIEAIMWHGYSKESDAYRTVEQFYNLPKADRDAIVAFINAI